MQVGVIAPEFPPEVGGIQTYAYEFVRELARRGHRLTVFTRRHPEGETSLSGVRVLPSLKLRRTLDRSILQEPNIDVWHVMNASYSWVALEASPVVISVHGNDFLRPYLPVARLNLQRLLRSWRSPHWLDAIDRIIGEWRTRHLVHRALPRAAHILANSRYTERVLLERYPECQGITSAAMVGVSPEYLDADVARALPGHSRLISVCRLADRRKNVANVLEALALLKERYKFTYTIIGDGPLRTGLEQLAHDLGLDDRVQFTGFVASAELHDFLAQSDLLVLTSSIHPASHEGFGIVYLEANACGTPVLAARLAGAVEAVDDGITGFFVDDPSVASIAMALEQFFCQKVWFDPAACKAFAARFTWEEVVDHALRYYPPPVRC